MKVLWALSLLVFSFGGVANAGSLKLKPGFYVPVSSAPNNDESFYTQLPMNCGIEIKATSSTSVGFQWIDAGVNQFCLEDRDLRKFLFKKSGIYQEANVIGHYWTMRVLDQKTFINNDTSGYHSQSYTYQKVESKPEVATLVSAFDMAVCKSYRKIGDTCDINGEKIPFEKVTNDMILQSSFCETALNSAAEKAMKKCKENYPNRNCNVESREDYAEVGGYSEPEYGVLGHTCHVKIGARAH